MDYIGRLEYDGKLQKGLEHVVIFGGGERLPELLKRMDQLGLKKRILCICDNDRKKWGQTVDGIEILPPEEVFQKFKDCPYILYNKYSVAICRQLLQEGISKIHLIRL